MATEPKTTGLTYEDLRAFPEDNLRREIIDGELFMTAAPSWRHQLVVAELTVALGAYRKQHGGRVLPAPTDVFFSDANVAEPDVLFLRAENLGKLGKEPFVRSAPDLVVEVSSPSTRKTDLTRKKGLYERFGVPEYWFVDLDAERIEVYRLQEARYGPPLLVGRTETLESPLLPGFRVAVDDLLGRPEA